MNIALAKANYLYVLKVALRNEEQGYAKHTEMYNDDINEAYKDLKEAVENDSITS